MTGAEGTQHGSTQQPIRPPARCWAVAGVGAAAGIGAAAAGIGVAEVFAVGSGPSSAPLIAVAQTFIDHTPGWLKEFAITTFGTHDKQVLLGTAAAVLLAAAVVAGLLARRSPGAAICLVLGLAVVASIAAATRPDATALAPIPSVVGGVVSAVVLIMIRSRVLSRSAGTEPVPADGADPEVDGPRRARRAVLISSGTATLGGAVAWFAGRSLGVSTRAADASRAQVALPSPVTPEPALPVGVEVAVPGVVPFRVPTADFYRIDTATLVPQIRAQNWKLRVHGMVAHELTLDYAELLASGLVERDVTLICVSNEVGGDLIGNARWLGAPIGPLLRRAVPDPEADMVLSTSQDGWTCSTPLEVLTDGRDALLAVGMNGEPLPLEHGFPVRMVVPGLYGYVSATKWVIDLEVTRFDREQGYWTSRGWSARGPVKTESRIDVPSDGAALTAGTVAVAGVAWAQHRGINGVQVRIDDGPWQDARLGAEASVDTWRQWVFRWQAGPGRHRITVRAKDGTGTVQTQVTAPPEPDGATGWHTIEVDVG